MKIVFVGPSLPDAREIVAKTADIEIRPPACQGDVMRALNDGATAIGLIDGQFEFVAPIWHKELIFALSRGIPVFGASSMGALRAAECEAFGMVGIGRIFEDYKHGLRVDDADVALLHGPEEMGYPALSVPLVNIDATLAEARRQDLLDETEVDGLAIAAQAIFFKERSWRRVAETAGMDWNRLRIVLETSRVDQKRQDALDLLTTMTNTTPIQDRLPDWQFNATPLWRKLYP